MFTVLPNFAHFSVTGGSSGGNGDAIAVSGVLDQRLYQTGVDLLNLITLSNAGVGSLNGLSGVISLTGTGNISIVQSGNTIWISGRGIIADTLSTIIGNSPISTGQFSPFIQFPRNFDSNPIVIGNIYNLSGDPITAHQISGTSTSGFYVNLSDYLTTDNYKFSYIATTGTGFFNLGSSSIDGGVSYDTGQFYPASNPQNYSTSGNVQNTGQNLQSQINSINSLTGNFYLKSNPSGFITGFSSGSYATISYVDAADSSLSVRLGATGSNLISLINAASAGVSSLNGFSGIVTIIGTGNITVTTGTNRTIIISGDTGNYINFATVSNLQTTGQVLYNYINNLSGIFDNSGAQYQGQINTLTSNLQSSGISLKNTDNLISGNLFQTGSTLNSKINVLSGFTTGLSINLGATGSNLYNLISNTTGYINTNPSGFIRSTQTGQFVSTFINVTGGGNRFGSIIFTGVNNITVHSGSNTVIVSGNSNLITTSQTGQFYPYSNPLSFSSSGNVQNTGQSLQLQINSINAITGNFYFKNNPSGYITGFNSGQYATASNLQLTGINLTNIITGLSGFISGNFVNNISAESMFVHKTGEELISGVKTLYNGIISTQIFSLVNSGYVDVISSLLYDNDGNGPWPSLDWNQRYLQTGNMFVTLDWGNKTLNEAWTASQFRISGVDIGNLSNRLYNTGNTLLGLISAASAGVSSLRVTGGVLQSGSINISGLGSVTVLTGLNNYIYISGSSVGSANNSDGVNLSGNLYTTGSNLYKLINNFSGVFVNTGTQFQNQINSIKTLTGSLYPYNNPSNFANSGNLQSTGQSLQSQINALSGNLITTGQNLINLINNITGINVTTISGINIFESIYFYNADSQDFNRVTMVGEYPFSTFNIESGVTTVQSGSGFIGVGTGLFYLNSNPSGFITAAQAGGVSNITVTGKSLSGIIRMSGLGSVTVSTGSNNFIYISGSSVGSANNSDGVNLSGNLYSTGSTLYNLINNFSGVFVNTGARLQGGLNSLSGNLYTTGSNLYKLINNFSGVFVNTGTRLQGGLDSLSGNLFNTGKNILTILSNVTGYFNTNPSGYLRSGDSNSCNVFSEIYLYNSDTSKFNKVKMVGTDDSLALELYSGVDSVQCGSGFVSLSTGSYITTGTYYKPTQLYSGVNPITIDWSSGNCFKYILTGNVRFSFNNTRDGQTIVVGMSNTGTKNYSGFWPSNVHWPSDITPQQSSGSKMDIYTFISLHTGIYGNAVQGFGN